MRLSKENVDAKIVELYKSGCSFRQLQKRYHKSPNYIAKLVKGIVVVCTRCGKPKGKMRFHAHHPDRINRPDYTLPYCPSCHAKEEAKIRRDKANRQQPILNTTSTASLKTEGVVSTPNTTSLSFSSGEFSPTVKKVLTGIGIGIIVEALSPGFFERRWQEMKEHWNKT